MAATGSKLCPNSSPPSTGGGRWISTWMVSFHRYVYHLWADYSELYVDVGEELRISLLEEYANQRNPTNGEIYRKIRQYEEEQNEPFQQRWLARLLRCNRERLEQLDNRRNRRLRQGFNALLAISGLWGREMRISMIHRLVAIDCVEEILNYLESVKEFWSSLVDHHPIAMKRIDQDTVEKLQLMARRASRVDAQAAYGFILSGQAFAGFSETERRTIWTRMERFGGLVPSLHTFFEDCKYLESCAQCIKRLFSPPDESIWKSITPMLVTSPETEEDCLVQTSESTFRQTRMAGMERLDIAYRQVWLYAMRHYPSMPADPKNDDDLLAKPNRAKADECVVYQMAALAHRLGFRSTEITELMNQSPDRQIARPALLKARKPGRFRYNPQVFETLVDRIVDCFSTADPDEPRTTPSSQNTYTQTAVSTPPSTQSTANGDHRDQIYSSMSQRNSWSFNNSRVTKRSPCTTLPDEPLAILDIVLPEYQDQRAYMEESSPPDLVDPERVNRFSAQRPAESDTGVADLIEQIDAKLEEPMQADNRIQDEDHQEHQQQQSDQNLSSWDKIAHDLEERERLDAEWERERLEQELNIIQPAETPQPQPEVSQEILPPGGNNSNQEQPVTEPDVESTAIALRADRDDLNDSSNIKQKNSRL
uniref:Uncharacterized protein n=1 Tax=Coccidioides posadasii RMSCC 3488 TaxID=454284 RepID=A0A0J6F5Z4_COCPO|nr:hypothetical protein CPAG_00726 [Coccidioides posadasii RMSCC 3488]